MNNLIQRLLLFAIAIPGLVAMVIFLPQFRHGATALAVIAFTAGAGSEIGAMLSAKGMRSRPSFFALIAALPPLLAYLALFFPGSSALAVFGFGLACIVLLLLAPLALARKEELETALPVAVARIFALIYPGFLSVFMILIVAVPARATEAILGFALMTFGNDSLAWLVGITMGKRRNLVPVSPNKSGAGFVGGLLGSMIAGALSKLLFPEAFSAGYLSLVGMGLAVGILVILGDLFESALKRSAGFKDSGSMIPGRGGFLDSFDSLLFAAPVYYGFSLLLGLFS